METQGLGKGTPGSPASCKHVAVVGETNRQNANGNISRYRTMGEKRHKRKGEHYRRKRARRGKRVRSDKRKGHYMFSCR